MCIADGMEEMKGNYNSLLNESVAQKKSIEKLHTANINLQNQLNTSFKERSKLSALVPLLKSPDRSSSQRAAAANTSVNICTHSTTRPYEYSCNTTECR
jgi:FtsZ-binding cell division protein ZapB